MRWRKLLAAGLLTAGALSLAAAGCSGTPEHAHDAGHEEDAGHMEMDGGPMGSDAGDGTDAGQGSDGGNTSDGGSDGGSSTDGGSDGGSTVSFSAQIQPIFNTRCTAGCHSGATPSAGLNLSSGASYAQLVNVMLTCSGQPGNVRRVKANELDKSMLWLKVNNDPTRCGDPMPPPPAVVLGSSQLALIQQWIQQGAPNN